MKHIEAERLQLDMKRLGEIKVAISQAMRHKDRIWLKRRDLFDLRYIARHIHPGPYSNKRLKTDYIAHLVAEAEASLEQRQVDMVTNALIPTFAR